MRLQLVRIQNHARIPDVEIRVQDHLVLVGPNESGKSSILTALSLLLSGSASQLYSYFKPELLSNPQEPLVVEAELGGVVDEDGTYFPHEITVLDDCETRVLRIRLEASIDPADPTSMIVARSFPEAGHTRSPSRAQLDALGWRFLPASRNGAAYSADSTLRGLVSELEMDPQTMDTFRSPLRQFNTALSKAHELTTLRHEIARQMAASLPRDLADDDVELRSGSDPDEDPLAGVRLFIRSKAGTRASADQSDGVRQILSMSLNDFANRSASMLAVDEPEVHLHPSSQRTIAGIFQASPSQKIIATHSPYIVHAFDPESVVALTSAGCSSITTPDRFTEAEKLKAHWWSPQTLEALTANHVIFVEGVADRVVVEAAARALAINLQRHGIFVFSLDGADNFSHVYKLLGPGGFDIPWSGLVDEDHRLQWLGVVGGRPRNILGKTIWVSDADLEDEYCNALGSPRMVQALVEAGVIRKEGLLQAANVSAVEDIPLSALAKRCRDDKVAAAAAIVPGLTRKEAEGITSIFGLLKQWIPDAHD